MTTNNLNYSATLSMGNIPLHLEQKYKFDTVRRPYKSAREELLCWGEESSYLDSEFSNELENTDQGNVDDADYDDALDEDPADEEDDDPYEDFEEEEDETDEEDFEKEDLDEEDLNDEDLE